MSVSRICLVVICALWFGGCAGSIKQIENEALLPEIDVVQVKENSDEALKLAQEAKLDVEVLSTKMTDIDNKLILLSEEVSSVSSAKIEEIENRLALLIEAYKDLAAQMKSGVGMSAAVSRTGSKAGPTDPTFSPSSAASILVSSSEYDTYQQGLRAYNTRNYEKANKVFADVLEKYPSGQYADNSHYWIGECYYALGDFASGIASFKRVLDFQNSSKSDDAQLKIGLSYLKLGQPALAKAELKNLVDRYPSSEYVSRAQKYLAELK